MTLRERIQDILDHPENHRHGIEELEACCTVNGTLDVILIETHASNTNPTKVELRRCESIILPNGSNAWWQ